MRRYLRGTTPRGATALLVLYPEPSSAAQATWRALRDELEKVGVRVPACHEDDPALGAALVEDLGDVDLSSEIEAAPAEERERLLDEAEEILVALRELPRAAATLNPPFDEAFFSKELAATRHWAFEGGGTRTLPPDRAALWEELAGLLARAAADPSTGDPVPTHRDFHANNIMRGPDGRLAVIDFQDLRLGPPDYDPVSLRFERAGEKAGCSPEPYSDAVLLQRAWKVLGTFEKMLTWGRQVYRPHRETTLRVLRRCSSPRFAPLLALLD